MDFGAIKEELKLLWPFYLDMFFSGIVGAIAAPVSILYFQSLGLDFFGISIVVGLPLIATLLFEIPTGAIADIYGRKFSVLLGMFLEAGLLFITPFFKTAFLLFWVFFLARVAGTFISGADDAWIVDLLKHNKKSHLVHNYYARNMTLAGAGIFIGGLLSSVVVIFLGLKGIWFVAGIAEASIALMLLVFAKEHFVRRKAKIKEALKNTLSQAKKGFGYIMKHPVLFWFVADSIVWSFAGIWSIAMQPYFRSLGMPLEWFGILFSIIGLIAIFAPFAGMTIMKIFKSEKLVFVTAQLIQIIVFILLLVTTNLYLALLFFLLSYPFGVATVPIANRFKQQFIPSKERATINSVFKAINVPGTIVGLLVGGKLLDTFGLNVSLGLVIFACASSIVFYMLMKPEGQKMHI